MAIRGSITTLVERAKARWPRAIQDALRVEVDRVVEQERKRWPVKTGESAKRLGTELGAGTQVRAVGRADYTTAIVSRRRRPWLLLVEAVRRRAVRQIPRAIGRAALRALRVR